jgi:hypothetical protein
MEKAAEKKDWMEMMKIMQDIRQFCSLHVKRSPKGGISSGTGSSVEAAFIGKSSDPAFSM